MRPIRPRAAWLWLVCSASVLFPESIVPVKNWSSAIGQDHAMQPTSPLISVDELSGVLDEVTVLDVRYRMGGPPGLPEHAAGHVPGAAYVDLDTALAAPPGPRGRHPLPEVAVFQAAMRDAGVADDRPVVVYDDWQGRAAGRCWWLLRWAGHADVRVLDGGWTAWVAAGLPSSTEPVDPAPGDFTARPGQLPTLDADEVVAFVEHGTLVDARDAGALSAARSSRSTRSPDTSPARSTCRRARTSAPDGTFRSARGAARGLRRDRGRRGRGVLRLRRHGRARPAGAGASPGSTACSTPARGASG